MAPPFIVTPIGPSAARLTRTVKAGGREMLVVVVVEVWGAGDDRAEIETRLAGGIGTVFERRSGSTTARVKAALEAADRWLRRLEAEAGTSPPANVDAGSGGSAEGGNRLGAGASILVLSGEEAILAQVGPAVAYVRAADPDDGARTEPARHPAASPWLRRGISVLAPQPLWSPLGMGGTPQAGDPEAGAEPDIHWAHWWMAPGSSVLLTTTPAALGLSREVVGPLLATAPDRIGAALASTLPAEVPALHVAHREAAAPKAAVSPQAAPQAQPASSQPATPPDPPAAGSRVAAGTAAAGATAATRTTAAASGTMAPAVPPPATIPGELPEPATPDSVIPGPAPQDQSKPDRGNPSWIPALALSEIDLAPAWRATRDAARQGAIGGARLGARVLLALLPARSGQGAGSYQADWARFAAAAAILLPLAVIGLVLVMRARASEGTLMPAAPTTGLEFRSAMLYYAACPPIPSRQPMPRSAPPCSTSRT